VTRMRNLHAHFKSFSREERKTVAGYLLNLIDANFGNKFSEELIAFCVDMIGKKEAYDLLKPVYVEKVDYSDIDHLFDWVIGKLLKPNKDMAAILHNIFYPALEKQYKHPKGRSNLELNKRLDHLQETFNLSDDETAILQLFYLMNTNIVVSTHLGNSPLDFSDFATLRDLGHYVLGLNRKPFLTAISTGILLDTGLLENEDSLSIA